ncbi:MAG TPA: DsbA family protein [Stellaceae bacterium]|nr:DsbA family protein [Stellaceae bacterium]
MRLSIGRAGTSASRPFAVRLKVLGLCFGAVLALVPPTVGAAEFTPEQRQAIEAIIKDYLTKNPDLMIDVLQAAEDKLKSQSRDKAKEALAAHRNEVFNDPDSPIAGNPKGDVTLVEFFDYRCPYCKQVVSAIDTLIEQDRQLRFVYKEFPILGPESTAAARAALAAHRQGKYVAFHRALMAHKGKIDDAALSSVAGSVGLDVKRLKSDMEAPEIDRMLTANLALAEALEIRGTPGFVIGDEIVPGAISLGVMKRLIEAARAK